MQILPALLVASVAVVSPLHPSPPRGGHYVRSSSLKRSDPVLVRAVIDGDTIDVTAYGRVRLLGIDAPELGHGFDTAAPFGTEARDRLASLVLHRWVRLEQDGVPLDAYNRHLAFVIREDGMFVNAALVRDGLARVSARRPLSRLDELTRAQADAQAFRRGMWGGAPKIPAAGYTRRSDGTRSPAASRRKPRSNAAKPKAKPRHQRGSDSC
jgi:endonuclease YncB( thermonuclease family)